MPTLDWIGKQAVVNHHREVPFRLLHCDRGLSVGDPDAGNLLVEGDNLLALKALLPYYAGKVKCIYIDPPYNTGNEGWVYNDNVNSPEIRRWLGEVVGREAEDLSRHDKWLCMMYPRLSLLREFLSEDGAIFVSIDDNETHHLRLLMQEVFGPRRFEACIAWQKRYSRENRGAIGDAHEYLMLYSADPETFKAVRGRVPLNERQARVYRNPNNDPRGRWRAIPMTAQGFRTNQMYTIVTPSGRRLRPPRGRCWSTIEPEFLRLKREGRIWFGKGGNSAPGVIRYLSEVEGLVPWTWWPHEEVGHTDEAKKELKSIFWGQDPPFDTPKPTRLLRRILDIAGSGPCLVLDSFAGSGTTGHAMLAANAEDGGGRHFILVEMEEQIAREVTRERLKRVIEGYETGHGENRRHVPGLGGGFRYCRLGDPLFDEAGKIRDTVRFPDLAAHVYFSETGSPIPRRANGDSPLLGTQEGRAVYLLYNGVLNDRRPSGGNVLTRDALSRLPEHDGPKVIYGEGCRLSPARLVREGIVFKQVPYEVRVG